MRFRDRRIHNISTLIKHLSDHSNGISAPIWYRGHFNKEWGLVPSSIRKQCETEINLIKKFKQDATLLVSPRPAYQYEWLFIMRHHGVPTRLLDWTENPLVATYFAVTEDMDKDGALWALLPLELNKQGGREFDDPNSLPSFEEDEFMSAYSPENYYKDTTSKLLPIAFIAPRNTPRMQSQLSVFTINHRDETPIENIGDKKHFWRYIIPQSSKENIKKELELLGVGKFQLFPELESIGTILRGD